VVRLGGTCKQLFRATQAEAIWRPLVKQTYGEAALEYEDTETDEEEETDLDDMGEVNYGPDDSSNEDGTSTDDMRGTEEEEESGARGNGEVSGVVEREDTEEVRGVEGNKEVIGVEDTKEVSGVADTEEVSGVEASKEVTGVEDTDEVNGVEGIGGATGEVDTAFEIKESNFRKLARNFDGLFKRGPSISTANSWKEVFMTEAFWKDQVATELDVHTRGSYTTETWEEIYKTEMDARHFCEKEFHSDALFKDTRKECYDYLERRRKRKRFSGVFMRVRLPVFRF
jgi:hypothetical protein